MKLRNRGLWIFALLLTAVIAFWPGLHGPFVLDDIAKIRDNPELKSAFELHSFFDSYESHKTHFRNDPSRPFVFMNYWVLWHIGEGSPVVFHIFSLLLHTATAFLIGLLVLNLLSHSSAAVFASFLYLLLPLNAGTVLYAFGLSDVLSAFFAVALALLLMAKTEWRGRDLWIPVLLFILGLASKQSFVILPLLLILLKPTARLFHIGLIGMTMVYLAVRFLAYGRIGDLEAVENYEAGTYLAVQGWVFWKYVLLALVPKDLCIDHALLPRHVTEDLRTLGWIAWLLTSLSATMALRSARGWIFGFGWLWWVLSLLPTGSFMPTTDLLVERRAYWPVIGLVLIASALWKFLWSRTPKVSLGLAVLLVIALGFTTNSRAQVWC
jgi:hypothetical protein